MFGFWPILLLPLAITALFLATRSDGGRRDRLLRALVFWGLLVSALTETLGSMRLLQRNWLAAAWLAVIACALAYALRTNRAGKLQSGIGRIAAVQWISALGIAGILALTGFTAALSPPNSADAMAYHMPRVIYWAEQQSVRYFPTPYLNQIMLQPMAEYLMLHTWLLAGSDRFINFVQWFASLGCIIAVSAVAREFGATGSGQALAALFCATLPSGILASSGAKNDYVAALWLVCAVYFSLRFVAGSSKADALLLGCSLGLALLTKATAYLFAPWPIASVLMRARRRSQPGPREFRHGLPRAATLAIAFALAINAPQFARNIQLSGSPLGFDSAQGNGYFRWRNETFGWKQTVSNMLRHGADQLGARSERWNRAVYDFVIAAHRRLNIDIADPATTWRGAVFTRPLNANHEANAPDRWHLLILALALCLVIIRRDKRLTLYAAGVAFGFLSFCAFLKWQPFMARLFLPLFVIAAPLASVLEHVRPVWIQAAVCLFLLNNARPAVFENWVRPLKGPRSILHRTRDEMYFSDMSPWNDSGDYLMAVEALRKGGCDLVAIDSNNFQLEYPLQALLREARPSVRFIHAGVANPSARYPQPVSGAPCAIVCLDCAADAARLNLYRNFTRRTAAGKFVILRR